MITTPEEFLSKLYLINSPNPPTIALMLPSNEKVYNVDLENRTIELPETLSVRKDQNAEFIYFKMDRYYDNMDMTDTVGLIQYINKNALTENGTPDLGHIYFIPYYDVTKETDKVIFPWLVAGPVTAAAGPVEIAMRFYRIDPNNKGYLFNLNTLPATSYVLDTLDVINPDNENFIIPSEDIEQLRQQIQDIEQYQQLYWEECY